MAAKNSKTVTKNPKAVKNSKTIAKWKISKLREHPKQAEMFGDVGDAELKALSENMRKHGLRDPVEITPNGTIIVGHQRVRAAKLLGWTEIEVVVRHDLVKQGPGAVEERFIEDNFLRRQLSPLARARCIRRLMEIEDGHTKLGSTKKEELKARIGQMMRLSVRSVNRYLLILSAPVPIQTAFDKDKLSLTIAGRVALQTKEVQAEIARRITKGESPASVAADCMSNDSKTGDVASAFRRIVWAIVREFPRIRYRHDEIPEGLYHEEPILLEVIDLFKEVVSTAKPSKKKAA